MTKSEILEVLNDIFVYQSITQIKDTFSSIKVGENNLKFYTYSEDSTTDCIWYCNFYSSQKSFQIKIPNEMPKEFIEEISKNKEELDKLMTQINKINKKFSEMTNPEFIRDIKLKKILD